MIMMMMIHTSNTLPEVRSGQYCGIIAPFSETFMYVTSLSLLNRYVSTIRGPYSWKLHQSGGKIPILCYRDLRKSSVTVCLQEVT